MELDYYNPTRVVFGAGNIAKLGAIVSEYGKKALIVTGGGSVKRNGTFDKAVKSLKEAGVEFAECEGIEPNPKITSVRRGVEIARKENCDVVIALGGGSTMDASKVIAAGALYDGDAWDLIMHGQKNYVPPMKSLPVITVPTLAATGSEMNCSAVISNEETKIKSFASFPTLYPKAAIVDPELTLTVPKDQTAYGVCDIIVHITEGYFNTQANAPMQDRFAESVMIETMKYGRIAVENGNDIEARAQVQWASILALNGWLQSGANGAGFPVHMIEHTLSAHHDITHGAGLAIVNPAWMRFAAKHNPDKFAQFAERVMGISADGKDKAALAAEGIDAYEAFLKEIGCPVRLFELDIDDKLLEKYAEDSVLVARDAEGRLPAVPPMTKEDIVSVLKAAL